jgi:hypothetical protein
MSLDGLVAAHADGAHLHEVLPRGEFAGAEPPSINDTTW